MFGRWITGSRRRIDVHKVGWNRIYQEQGNTVRAMIHRRYTDEERGSAVSTLIPARGRNHHVVVETGTRRREANTRGEERAGRSTGLEMKEEEPGRTPRDSGIGQYRGTKGGMLLMLGGEERAARCEQADAKALKTSQRDIVGGEREDLRREEPPLTVVRKREVAAQRNRQKVVEVQAVDEESQDEDYRNQGGSLPTSLTGLHR